jgi:hypothetical protein
VSPSGTGSKLRWWVVAVVAAATALVVGAVVAIFLFHGRASPGQHPAAVPPEASAAASAPPPAAAGAVPAPRNDPRGREAARRKLTTPGKRLEGRPTALPDTVAPGLDPRQRFGDFAAEAVRLHLRPVLAPCVEALLRRTPTASGKAIVVFDLLAGRDVGAILDEIEVERGSGPADATMEMCVRETLSGLLFAPPVPEGQGIFAFALDVR